MGTRSPSKNARSDPRYAGELALIDHIRTRAGRNRPSLPSQLALGIGDDCAILRPRADEDLLVTTDFSLEGRHFRRDWHTPASIGHRALARGLSDLASMGARPLAAFLSIALPTTLARKSFWVDGFLDGFFHLAERYGVPLAGGDTSQSPSDAVLIDIVLLGAAPRGKALRRDGARAGDRLFVTGSLGGAAATLKKLTQSGAVRRKPSSVATDPHFFPEPRLRAGALLLRRSLATAALDLSDGLSTDLHHLCQASGLCAEVDQNRLPLHANLDNVQGAEAVEDALHGGEDYELLFTVPPMAHVPSRLGDVPLTEVGRMLPRRRGRSQVTLVDGDGKRKPLAASGWEHLR